MPPIVDADSLSKLAVRVNVLSEPQAADAVTEVGRTATAQELAKLLERRGLLTPFQTGKLLKGERDGYFLGGYRILYRIASGTFGRVYRGDNPSNGEVVAVKVLRSRWSDPASMKYDKKKIDLFEREGKVGLTLVHPNIVRILAVNRDAGTNQYYIVMEFVEGGNLRDILSIRKKMSLSESLRILEETASGLAYAYSKGLMHRDMKATNILLSTTGTAKLVDFGLAELTDEAAEGDDTQVDRTVDYGGLERATNVKSGDPRSDVFFLGCVFYEMLLGRPALTYTKDKHQRGSAHRFTGIPPIERDEVEFPSVKSLCERMIAFNPNDRFQSAQQLLDTVQRVRADVTGAKTGGPAAPAGPKSLFLVELNDRLRDAMKEKFKAMGFRVMMSLDPSKALWKFKQEPFHALVVDAGTAGPEGVEYFDKVQKEAEESGIPCAGVLILSEGQADLVEQIVPRENATVLVRPVTLKQLTNAVQEQLGEAAGEE